MRLNNIIEYLLHPYNEGNISCIFFFFFFYLICDKWNQTRERIKN